MADRARTATVLLVLALATGGCSGGAEETATPPVAAPSSGAPRPAVPAASAGPPSPAGAPAAPGTGTADPTTAAAPPLAVPATRSGPLDAGTVPAPAELGPGWTGFVDPGDVAEGYLGNDAFVRERGADEVTRALVPLGCAGITAAPELPAPAHALEATYRHADGRAAVALVLAHADDAGAAALFAGLVDLLGRCPAAPPGEDGPDAPYRLVVEVGQAEDDGFTGTRRDTGLGATGTRWSQVVVLAGSRVGILVLQVPDDGPAAASPGQLPGVVRSAIDRS